MSRVTLSVMVIGFGLLYMYIQWRFDRIEQQLDGLSNTRVEKVEKQAETASAKTERPPPVARPSKNPNADVTGASARTQRRRAKVSDCQRVCRQWVGCVSSVGICPALPTDGQERAINTCAHACEKEEGLKKKLLGRTGCTEKSSEQLPAQLKFLCSR